MQLNRRRMITRLAAGAVGTLTGSWITVLSSACRRSQRGSRYKEFTAEARDLIAAIAETILPETNTPGARSAGVDAFVIRVLADCRSQQERDSFLKGLDEFEQNCLSEFGDPFVKCTPQQQLSLVEKTDREALGFWGKVKQKLFHQPHFFKTLKELVLIGYFTSQPGATKAASYEAIPGKWIGCLEMKSGQRTWATQ